MTTGFGAGIANTFVDSLEKLDLPLGYAEIAIEMACCRLCNISLNATPAIPAIRFTTADTSIDKLLERYSTLLIATFNSFNMHYQHYVDAFVEIPKNDIIGKSGVYNGENMIHFEIFSAKGVNIYKKLDDDALNTIVFLDPELFFVSSNIVETLKEPIETIIGSKFTTRFDCCLTLDECNQLDKSHVFLKYAVQHISEWSPELNYECFNKNHDADPNSHDICVMEQTDEQGETQPSHIETVNTETLFEKCIVPYYWRLDSTKWQNDFPGDVCTFYHPFYFLQQINKNDEKSRDLHEPEDE